VSAANQILDPTAREALAARLRFYRDLGLTDFYRRAVDPALIAAVTEPAAAVPEVPKPVASEEISAPAQTVRAPSVPQPLAEEVGDDGSQPNVFSNSQFESFPEEPAIPARKPFSAAPPVGNVVAPADRSAALLQIIEDIGDCKRCPLHKGRHSIVFGQGDANARLMFVGEGPGADEDAQGLPFVGRAGQLLNNMITAMGLKREETYICNVVKCRPPGNRTPEPDEANTCSQFLFRQIDVVRPQVIVALGATAATYLLGQRQPLAGLRGRVHAFRGASLIVTYHPAYLLRDPRQKKEAWADLQIAMKELGLTAPKRG
jgi:uracil-DNA glycosylase